MKRMKNGLAAFVAASLAMLVTSGTIAFATAPTGHTDSVETLLNERIAVQIEQVKSDLGIRPLAVRLP